jgi:Fe-S-cluster containining protein
MKCRTGCGACCIAISISSPIPGMPQGKPAGVKCINLSEDRKCLVHESDIYPSVCKNLTPSKEMCGNSFEYAYKYISELERLTKP